MTTNLSPDYIKALQKVTPETWHPVPGYEDLYHVSDLGRVKSLERTCFNGHVLRRVRESILKPTQTMCQTVCLSRDGKGETWPVARLVLTAFVRPPVADEVALHKDKDKWHHALENLEWGGRKDPRHPYYSR